MAITINSAPDLTTAGYRPVLFNVSSGTSGIVRIIADIYINGTSASDIKASIDKDPNYGTTYVFDFDFQSVCQDYLSADLEDIDYQAREIVNTTNSVAKIQIKFYEVIESGGVLTTAWKEDGSGTPETVSSFYYVMNTTLQHGGYINLDNYINDNSSKLFLTDSPFKQTVKTTETIQLSFLTSSANYGGQITQYDSSGSSVQATGFGGYAHTNYSAILLYDCSLTHADAAYFDVWLELVGSIQNSEKKRYYIDRVCNENALRLKWVNPLGGIDSHTFNARRIEKTSFKTQTYQSVKGVEEGYALRDRGDTVLTVDGRESKTIYSEAIDKEHLEWLSQIGLSNNVWIDNGVSTSTADMNMFVPVIVKGSTVKTLDSTRKVFQIKLDLVVANPLITMKG
jgi:hypothetical protein